MNFIRVPNENTNKTTISMYLSPFYVKTEALLSLAKEAFNKVPHNPDSRDSYIYAFVI